jgi:outer membrane protein assembly factor BamB
MHAGWLSYLRPQPGCAALLIILCLELVCSGADWPQYRGPNHDGVSTDRINKQWTGSVTNASWQVFLGNGVTSFAVSGGRALTQVHRDVNGVDMEVCVALNVTNGTEVWATPVDDIVAYDGGVGTTDDGPRTTPTVEGGSVYVLTSYLKLLRLNATNGTVVWSNDLRITYGGDVIGWQNAASPVVENGLIFLNANAGSSTLMALRTTNGALAWRSQNEAMTHSTPVLTTIEGIRQLVFATQSGLVSLNPTNGNLLWKSPYPYTYSTSFAASPAVHSNIVFMTANYFRGSFATRVSLSNTTWITTPLWTNANLSSHWATPVCHHGHLFGQFTPDDANAQLRCIDLASGITRWVTNGFGRGSVLLVGTNLLAITERGDLVLAAANTNAYQELGRFQAIPYFHTDTNKCWNAPAVCDGKVYVRSTAYGAAFDLSVPDLILDPPQLASQAMVSFVTRTVTGVPISSNRLAGMEVRASPDVSLALALWPKLTNALIFPDGLVRVTNVNVSVPHLFFMVSEPGSDLSVPRLVLDSPQFASQTDVSFAIRTVTGIPIGSNRLADMAVCASPNAGLSPALWPRLTNAVIYSNGLVHITNVNVSESHLFFIVREPQ